MTVSEWADRFRTLSTSEAAEANKWRTDRTPYLREPMDRLSACHVCRKVVMVFGAQLGKSEAGLNLIGYIITQAPRPLMILRPTIDDCNGFSRQRLGPLIASPAIHGLIADARSRDSGNTVLLKEFPGGLLILAGANAPSRLASWPTGVLFADEIDRFPTSAGGEGAPLELARRRLSTFGARRKELVTSTPTQTGASPIADEYEASSQATYHLPCPRCGVAAPLAWPQIRYTGDALGPAAGLDVWYECPACQGRVEEYEKTAMLAAGTWVHAHPDRQTDSSGYRLSALYAPVGWVSWREIVREHVAATRQAQAGNVEALRVWVNTRLAETWDDKGDDEIPAGFLQARGEVWGERIPLGVKVITIGVDTQDNRLEAEVVGWGDGLESWSLAFVSITSDAGDTAGSDWDDLDELRGKQWLRQDGQLLRAALTCIDLGGHRTDEVYRYTRARSAREVVAVMGKAGNRPVVERKARKSERHKSAPFRLVGVDSAKSDIFRRLRVQTPGPGYFHVPKREEDWYLGLVAEHRVTTHVRGQVHSSWVKHRERNEPLDCRVYAYAAWSILQIEGRLKRLEIAPDTAAPTHADAPAPAPAADSPAIGLPERPRPGYTGSRPSPSRAGPVRPYGGILHGRLDPSRA